METCMTLTSAGEVGVWLIDQSTGELYLETQRGIKEDRVKEMRLPVSGDSLIASVIQTGKVVRARRKPGGEQIRIKTDYFVESLVYIPLTLGGTTFGVLSAAHRTQGRQFDKRDEQLLMAIAHFAAIALQNARLHRLADSALEKRARELAALNEL